MQVAEYSVDNKCQVDLPEEEMVRCGQLATSFYNFTVTVDDFAALMESVENYRCQTIFICSFMWVST